MKKTKFQAGGALDDSCASLYVERAADKEVWNLLQEMQYVLIEAPRQQGKTSLVAHVGRQCRLRGDLSVVHVDLSSINTTEEDKWYQRFFSVVADAKSLPKAAGEYWRSNSAHDAGGLLERVRFLAKCLEEEEQKLVLAIDEVGAMESPGSSQFFTNLRALYNERAFDMRMKLITFLFAGAFRPSDLIHDKSISPFNVAVPVRLSDFDIRQILQLVKKGGWKTGIVQGLTERIFYWTNGHPYMTQAVCCFLQPNARPGDVDAAVSLLDQQDTGHFLDIIRHLEDRDDLKECLKRVLERESIQFAPAQVPWQSDLELMGLITTDEERHCVIRNRVYERMLRRWFESPHAPPHGGLLFISYSHQDRRLVHEFQKVFKPYADQLGKPDWIDVDQIRDGYFENQIKEAMAKSKVAILFVSPSYLASDFVQRVELPVLVEYSKKGKLRLAWVALVAAGYEHTPLKDIHCLNDPKIPLLNRPVKARRFSELKQIADSILNLMR